MTCAEQLCIACGLCCNGVLFKDVELQPTDDAARLLKLVSSPPRGRTAVRATPASALTAGPPLQSAGANKLPQPCAALRPDGRCRVYADRPLRCRQFDCALLQAVRIGRVKPAAALVTIRGTQGGGRRVDRLLRRLGDDREELALGVRFRRLRRRLNRGAIDRETAGRYAVLTRAVHDLNLRLRRSFFPDPADGGIAQTSSGSLSSPAVARGVRTRARRRPAE